MWLSIKGTHPPSAYSQLPDCLRSSGAASRRDGSSLCILSPWFSSSALLWLCVQLWLCWSLRAAPACPVPAPDAGDAPAAMLQRGSDSIVGFGLDAGHQGRAKLGRNSQDYAYLPLALCSCSSWTRAVVVCPKPPSLCSILWPITKPSLPTQLHLRKQNKRQNPLTGTSLYLGLIPMCPAAMGRCWQRPGALHRPALTLFWGEGGSDPVTPPACSHH